MPVALLSRPIRYYAAFELRSRVRGSNSTLICGCFYSIAIRLCGVRAVSWRGEGFWLLRYATQLKQPTFEAKGSSVLE